MISPTLHDDGVIKFNAEWEKTHPYPEKHLHELIEYRQKTYSTGLIGAYDDGISFGNISQRYIDLDDNQYIYISGSATGYLKTVSVNHFCRIDKANIDQNTLTCSGPLIASSESMSHMALYQLSPDVGGIIHGHSHSLWEQLLHKVPTTSAGIPYGTPEMAYAIMSLYKDRDMQSGGIFVMAGHKDGIFTFGSTPRHAYSLLTSVQEHTAYIISRYNSQSDTR